jgi:hypothetical protein
LIAAIALAGCAWSGAQAAQVTLPGDHFDVTYDDSLKGLFGTPQLIGDVLYWFPSGSPGFSAQVSGADGLAVTNSTFALLVTAKPTWQLTGAGLSEGGDYYFFGSGSAGVSASGQLRMTSVDPAAATVSGSITAVGSFSPNSLLDFSTKDWSASASVSLAGPSNRANVSIENILAAWAAGGAFLQSAFIEKKEVSLSIGVSLVPEVQPVAMFLAGLGVVGWLARRRLGARGYA